MNRMKQKRARNNPKRIFNELVNTIKFLDQNDLTIFSNSPVYEEENGNSRITWPNHTPGRINCNKYFGSIRQYRHFLKYNLFTSLLFDGSLMKISYKFEKRNLVAHNLTWWPSPFIISADDLSNGSPLDIFDLYAQDGWDQQIRMRTPVRFDFDLKKESTDHPASHLHMQTDNCRLYVDRPMCFNRFVKFIFQNFYPDLYATKPFWDDLVEMKFGKISQQAPIEDQPYLGWNNSPHAR